MKELEDKVAGQAGPDNSAEITINEEKFKVSDPKKKSIISRHDCKFTYLVKKGKAVRTSNRNDVLLGKENMLANCGQGKSKTYGLSTHKYHQDSCGIH